MRVRYLETVLGGLWWIVGAVALGAGTATVVLAAGIGVTAALVTAQRRRPGAPLPHGGRGRVLRTAGITAALVAAAVTVLGWTGWGELAAPVACALVGGALMAVASQLGDRMLVGVGVAMLVLAAAGAVLALGSVGRLYPQGLVGLAAGALLWAAAAHRTGLVGEARRRALAQWGSDDRPTPRLRRPEARPPAAPPRRPRPY